jgi:ribosome recycling factor
VYRPTAERIKAMGKMIKQEGESTRVAVRTARKMVMEQVRKLTSEDSRRQEEKRVSVLMQSDRALLHCKSIHMT